MTIPNTPVTPAGWYPDPAGTPRSRWWDGTQWTENYHDPLGAAQISGQALTAPEGTETVTPWYWAMLALLTLNILNQLLAFLPANLNATIDKALEEPTSIIPTYTPYEIFSTLFSLLLIAGMIVFAFLDFRALKAAGVPKPFHWAWSFFSLLLISYPLYLIGRVVVLKRRTGSSLTPIWIPIAFIVIIVVISIVAGVIGFQAAFDSVDFS